jgi:WD40 repeat protein
MVIERGGRLFPKLLDFGIAKMPPEVAPPVGGPYGSPTEDPALEDAPNPNHVETMRLRVQAPFVQRTPTAPGSPPAYMALEQWHNAENAGPAADIYSLGVVAYQALTGRLPFTADNTHDYFRQHHYALPPPLSPPEVDRVIQTALARSPGGRQKSALEMASELRRALQMSRREQLRSSAQQWDDQDRAPGLLWGPDVLADVTRQIPLEVLSELECSFVVGGLRRAAFMLARALQPRLAEQARLTSTSGRMWSAAFSPDGQQIVTTDDRAAQVWDARTYRRMFTLFHGDTVYQSVYSADGAQLVTAGGDGTVKIWDAASGALVRELRRDGARLRYFIPALSPDGKLVAAIDTRGDVAHVWDAASGAPVSEIRNDGLESPGIAFSPDGRWLATTGGNDVHVLDARTWRTALTIRGARIHRLAFDPTGSRLVTGATTGDAALWSVPSGARIRHLHNAGESIDAVAFSPNGQLIAAGSHDGAVQIWRAGSGELQSQLNPRHSKISAVEFDRASRLVLAASADGTVIVAEVGQGVPVAVLDGPQSVLVAHFDPDSHRVVGASLDSTARVWDATPPYHRWSSSPVADNCGLSPSPTAASSPSAVETVRPASGTRRRTSCLPNCPA